MTIIILVIDTNAPKPGPRKAEPRTVEAQGELLSEETSQLPSNVVRMRARGAA